MPRTTVQDADREEIARFIEQHWHSRMVMSRGRAFFPHLEQGIVERRDGRIVGLLTFRIDREGMEILTHNSVLEGHGIGFSLLLDAIEEARRRDCPRVWLTTTNANIKALGYYQRLGFRIAAVHPGVVDEARKVKPQIPQTGEWGIPIHDEIVMELPVKPFLDA